VPRWTWPDRLAGTAGPRLEWDEAEQHTFAGEPASPGRPPTLFLVTSSVPAEDRAEFDAWFDTEHLPLLPRVPGWNTVHRYRVRGSSRRATHPAPHYLEGPSVRDSEGRVNAGRTNWTRRLATRPWFHDNIRSFYQAVECADGPDRGGLRPGSHPPTRTRGCAASPVGAETASPEHPR
jgi:hypothetical protein